MPVRGIWRGASIRGYCTPTNAPIRVDTTSNVPLVAPKGTGTSEYPITMMLSTSGARLAAGSGALVSGSGTVATGLTSVLGFQATVYGATGFATGATEVDEIIVASITTGAVTVNGVFSAFVTGARTLSASGTATFYWWAAGM